jgi:hypothetical protein
MLPGREWELCSIDLCGSVLGSWGDAGKEGMKQALRGWRESYCCQNKYQITPPDSLGRISSELHARPR